VFLVTISFLKSHAQGYVFDFEISGYEQNPPIANISPAIIAVDANGNVFLAEANKNCVHKFKKDGTFIKKWEVTGTQFLNGGISYVRFLSVDTEGNVYVTGDNRWIKKYSNDGVFITQWGSAIDNIGGMNAANDVDGLGNVYTLCSHAERLDDPINKVKKFNSTGTLLATWGTEGTYDGQIYIPTQLKADTDGNVYVMDNRIQKFTSTGDFLFKIDLSFLMQSQYPLSIATDPDNNLYVVAESNFIIFEGFRDITIYKYNAAGTFLSSIVVPSSHYGRLDFDASGNLYLLYNSLNQPTIKVITHSGSTTTWPAFTNTRNGQFILASAIATDLSGNLFALDPAQNRIQKFNSSGQFITSWNPPPGPADLAVDMNGNVYVTQGFSIHKYTNNGVNIKSWDIQGGGVGLFQSANFIGIDGLGNVYVSNSNQNIQKFTSDGNFIMKWNINSQVNTMAVDISGFVYLSYSGDNYIYSYTNTGVPVDILGDYIFERATYYSGLKLALDQPGNIFFTDPVNNRIQKVMADGWLLDTWSSYGCSEGKIDNVWDLTVDALGYVYVADVNNRRIQKFRPTSLPPTGILTGIDNRIEKAELLTIYPNPSSGSFTIRMEEDVQSVTLINSTGITEIHTGKEITTAFTGLILVEIQTAETRIVKKLIIQ